MSGDTEEDVNNRETKMSLKDEEDDQDVIGSIPVVGDVDEGQSAEVNIPKQKDLRYDELILPDLPNSEHYEKSYTQRDVVSHIVLAKHVGSSVLTALYNDIILDNIFNSCKNLKNCRLVCHKWSDVITSMGPARLCFKYIWVDMGLSFERNLMKWIFLDFFKEEQWYYESLRPFCEEFGEKIVRFTFRTHGAYKNLTEDIAHVFVNNLCPNIRRLEGIKDGDTKFDCIYLPVMPKLEFIDIYFVSIVCWGVFDEDDKRFLQLLLINAPNLLGIKYYGAYDMDFSNNKKLKSIEFLQNFDMWQSHEYNVDGLQENLTQTAKSLQNLRLDFIYDYQWSCKVNELYLPEEEKVAFPKMPRLTTLELYSFLNVPIGRYLDNLSPELLPSLKILKLSSKFTEDVVKSKEGQYPPLTILEELAEKKGRYQHNGVVKLSLKGVKNISLLKDLRSFFPNLESFEVELLPIKEERDNVYENSAQLLTNLVNALKFLELKELRIIIPFKFDTLDLVEALKLNYMDLFKGLKKFHLENRLESNVDTLNEESEIVLKNENSDPFATLLMILLHTKNVKFLDVIFTNILFKATTFKKVMDFVSENKIPIKFT